MAESAQGRLSREARTSVSLHQERITLCSVQELRTRSVDSSWKISSFHPYSFVFDFTQNLFSRNTSRILCISQEGRHKFRAKNSRSFLL